MVYIYIYIFWYSSSLFESVFTNSIIKNVFEKKKAIYRKYFKKIEKSLRIH